MKTQMFTMRGMAFLFPVMIFVQSGLTLAIYWIGAYLINGIAIPAAGTAEETAAAVAARAAFLGDVVAFNSYAMYVVMSFVLLMAIFMILPRAQVSAARINEVLDAGIAVREGEGAGEVKEKGTVEFCDVSFRYPDASEDCLKHISFKANQGETVAFIGATGSGKSTLAGLAARLYDVTEGKVLIDGEDIRAYTFRELYDNGVRAPESGTVLRYDTE